MDRWQPNKATLISMYMPFVAVAQRRGRGIGVGVAGVALQVKFVVQLLLGCVWLRSVSTTKIHKANQT